MREKIGLEILAISVVLVMVVSCVTPCIAVNGESADNKNISNKGGDVTSSESSHNADYTLIESIAPTQSIYNYTSTQASPKIPASYELLFKCGSVNLTEGLDYSLSIKMASAPIAEETTENILVQFYHDPNLAQANILKNLGYDEIDYIPNNAFFASVPIANVTKLANLSFVRAVSQIRPEWKISPSLLVQMTKSPSTGFDVLVITFADKDYPGLIKLENRTYEATLNYNPVMDLAKDNNVKWIQIQAIDRQMLSESVPLISADDVWTSTGTPTGSGVMVGVIDSGIDPDHDHFKDKEKLIYAKDWVDGGDPIDDPKGGHGTRVAGVIAGNSTCDGVDLKGVAPNATLIIERIFGATDAEDYTYAQIFDEVVKKGASIVSCSWGNDSNKGEYDYKAKKVDEYAREHPDVLFVFANGNGPKDEDDTCCISPGIAKNVVAVGAIQDGSTWAKPPSVDVYSAPMVDLISNLNDLDGPVDGRVKPDVLAPGERITSAFPGDTYKTSRGSSFATPHVSGIAALYKELYPDASANQIKAALIHTAFKLDDKQGQTDYLQGWGKVEALDTLYNMSYESKSAHFHGNVSDIWPTEQTFTVDVPPSAKKLVVTMCYMDRAGSESAKPALVNDLDLSIVSPSGLEFVDRSSVNNIEKIILPEPSLQSGVWTIKVKATDIPGILETWQKYDGHVSVITEDASLDVDVPLSVTANVNENFTIDITASASGKLVSGVYVNITVPPRDSFIKQTSGSSGYVFGDMDAGESKKKNPTFKCSKAGTFTDEITVNVGSTNAGITTKKVTLIILENQPPTASFTFSPPHPFVGEVVTFDGSDSSDIDGTIEKYEWDFGDEHTAIGKIVTHPYSSAGSYDVTLTVTDDDGATDSVTKTISVEIFVPEEKWNVTFGGTDLDRAYSVQQTADGGYILTGYTSSYGAGNYDIWLVKTDSIGNKQWDKTFGGAGWDVARSVQQTTDGGYILAGDTGPFGTAGSMDFWLVKTDSNGNEQWNKTFGGTGGDYAHSVKQTTDGGYILAGYTGSYGAGRTDVWLVKTDSNGNKQWDKTFGGSDCDYAHSVQQTADGGYILTGYTYSYDAMYGDVWLVKTDSNGNKQWDKTFGRTYHRDIAFSVQQTTDGGYILAGFTESYGAGFHDFWLIKTDCNGNEQWDKTFGGAGFDCANSVQQTADDGYILAGYTNSYGAGNYDFWLVKTDSNGNKEWDKTFGGTDEDQSNSAQQTSDDGYIISGYTKSHGAGDADFWLIKVDGEGTVNNPPIASFTYSPPHPSVGQVITFDASASEDLDGSIVSYEWDFDDEHTATGEIVTHPYASVGDYDARLTVTDDDGATDSVTKTISVAASDSKVSVIIGVNSPSFMSQETEKLKTYLNEMGITPTKIFFTSDTFEWADFEKSDLIIYHNMGYDWTDYKAGKSPLIYSILSTAKENGTPILALGDDITWRADDSLVYEVLHLHSADSNGGAGTVSIIEETHPVILGDYGTAADFRYGGDMDKISRYGSGTVVATHDSYGTPVIFCYEEDANRVVSLNLNLYIRVQDRNGNVAVSESDREAIETIFKNSVSWLLNKETKNKPPTADFTYSPKNPKVEEIVTFNASNSTDPDGTIVKYKWEFGDRNITVTTEEIIKHSYGLEGDYSVNLTVTDDDGAKNKTSKKIIIQPDTTPPASITNLRNTTGQTWINWTWIIPADADFYYTMVYLDGIWKANTSYPFYNATELNPDTYYEIGTHTVDKVGNINATWVNQTAKTEVKIIPPVASFTYSPLTPTDLDNIQFTDTSTDSDGSIESRYWGFGDESTSTEQNPTHQYADDGAYTVNLAVTDDGGATDTVSKVITVLNVAPIANFTYAPLYPFVDQVVTLDASSSEDLDGAISSYEWKFGDGDNATGITTIHAYSSAGNYTVNLTVTDDDGAIDSVTKEITVSEVQDVIYVPDDYANIQDAVDAANEGNTIIVRDGAYTENINVHKRLTIQSENGADVTIVHAASSSDHVFEVTEDYVNISGFTVAGATYYSKAGFYLDNSAEHCNISDNNASNNFFGIRISSSSNNTLSNNTANSNTRGIALSSSSNNTISNNTANSNDFYGIYLDSSSNYNLIYNNYFNNSYNAYDYGNNIWNITKTSGVSIIGGPYLGGNYWSDYKGNDADRDGLGDTPYDIPGGANKDYLPLAFPTENKPPIASFTFSPQYPFVDQEVTFDASNSTDPDGTIVKYEWDFGDGNITSTTEVIIIHSYVSAGNYMVNLTVTDDDGAKNSTTKIVSVSEAKPKVSISTDKYDYTAGDTMLMTLTLANPTADWQPTYFVWRLDLPDYGWQKWITVTSLDLAPGYEQTFTIPFTLGDYGIPFNASWYAAFYNTTTLEVIAEDTADWKYVSGKMAEGERMPAAEEIAEEMTKIVEASLMVHNEN